jgi:hypothetical protein
MRKPTTFRLCNKVCCATRLIQTYFYVVGILAIDYIAKTPEGTILVEWLDFRLIRLFAQLTEGSFLMEKTRTVIAPPILTLLPHFRDYVDSKACLTR